MELYLITLSILLIVCQFAYTSTVRNKENGTQSVIDPSLLEIFQTKSTAEIVVAFSGNTAALEQVKTQKYATRSERLNAVSTALQTHAYQSQEKVARFLNEKNPPVTFTSAWINNSIFIKSASLDLVYELAAFPEVTAIRETTSIATIIKN